MTKLILAQGAEHNSPDRLAKIIASINQQRSSNTDVSMELKIDTVNKLEQIRSIESGYQMDIRSISIFMQDYVTEEKFDGYSYLNNEGRFFSKRLSEAKGNEGQPVEKTGHMPHLANVLKAAYEECGCDLHGELYIPGGISDDVTKILGCDADKAIARTKADWDHAIRFMLIDIRAYKGISLVNQPYYVRRAILEHVYNHYIHPKDAWHHFHLAPILTGDPREEFRRIVLSGGEGVIFKRTGALYIPGKKPADNWIKGKKKIYLDAVIMGYNEGTGKNKELFGSIQFGLYCDGKLKKMGNTSSGMNDETRAKIAADPDGMIGRVIEIEAIQESVKSFRNAVFIRLREDGDKSAIECTNTQENIKVRTELI